MQSLLLAVYFGRDDIEESSNLNWSTYHGGTSVYHYRGDNDDDDDDEEDGEGIGLGRPAWWARILSRFVTIYPAIDGISSYALCAISLGDIIMGSLYGQKVHTLRADWRRTAAFRFLGAVPQLIGAAFIRDLSAIANYAGLFTVMSYTICPCLLEIYSRRIVMDAGLSEATRHDTIFSNETSAWTIAFLGISTIVYTLVASLSCAGVGVC